MTETDAGLRERLVDVGVQLPAAEGMSALTLREIARRAGVSHGAPRRRFPTRLELLSAIARRGFTDLAGRAARVPQTGDPRARLDRLAHGYLECALENPGMYEPMFRHDLLESGHLGPRETSLPLFALLADLVGAVLGETERAEARREAGALGANLHGIAQLWRWGSLRLAVGEDDSGPLPDAALSAHLGPAFARVAGGLQRTALNAGPALGVAAASALLETGPAHALLVLAAVAALAALPSGALPGAAPRPPHPAPDPTPRPAFPPGAEHRTPTRPGDAHQDDARTRSAPSARAPGPTHAPEDAEGGPGAATAGARHAPGAERSPGRGGQEPWATASRCGRMWSSRSRLVRR